MADRTLTEAGERDLQARVQSAGEMMEALDERVEAGDMELDEAQEEARVRLSGEVTGESDGGNPIRDYEASPFTYGAEGYFYAFEDDGMTVLHPVGIEGDEVYDLQDEDGEYMIQGLIAAANQDDPDDRYYTYMWTNEGETNAREKYAYMEHFEPWGWNYGLAAYTEEFNAAASYIGGMAVLIGGLSAGAAGTTFFFLMRRVNRQIAHVTTASEEIAAGDLRGEALPETGRTELAVQAAAVNRMKARLTSMIHRIHDTSNHVAASSEELTASAQENTSSSEQTAHEIQGVAEKAEAMRQQSDKSLEAVEAQEQGLEQMRGTSAELRQTSESSLDVSRQGAEEVEATSGRIASIEASVEETMAVMKRLEGRSREINEIVQTMTDISEQTNLLALNASIEAARAGEAGKGFAVVADEVRKLAEQSGTSAEKITGMIHDVQHDTDTSVDAMTKVQEEVQAGVSSMQSVRGQFEEMKTLNEDVDGRIVELDGIVGRMNEQAASLKETMETFGSWTDDMTDSTSTVAATSEQSLAAMNEIADTSEQLSATAVELQEQIQEFRLRDA
ncbi:methyl-accepting chemotaxis protein [Alkalicoccus chagannorensis]|nr:methyl-accepting chemotaxis protein [Alkalicoccus chagannorensis]